MWICTCCTWQAQATIIKYITFSMASADKHFHIDDSVLIVIVQIRTHIEQERSTHTHTQTPIYFYWNGLRYYCLHRATQFHNDVLKIKVMTIDYHMLRVRDRDREKPIKPHKHLFLYAYSLRSSVFYHDSCDDTVQHRHTNTNRNTQRLVSSVCAEWYNFVVVIYFRLITVWYLCIQL